MAEELALQVLARRVVQAALAAMVVMGPTATVRTEPETPIGTQPMGKVMAAVVAGLITHHLRRALVEMAALMEVVAAARAILHH
jgi:hypothetical protein